MEKETQMSTTLDPKNDNKGDDGQSKFETFLQTIQVKTLLVCMVSVSI